MLCSEVCRDVGDTPGVGVDPYESDHVDRLCDVSVDGSECTLHPDYKQNKIAYREVRAPGGEQLRTTAPLVPKAGPGKSDGPGTFQAMIRQTADHTLKWDQRSFATR